MPSLSFSGLFSSCTDANAKSCMTTTGTDVEQAAAKGLVLVSDLLNWVNNTTNFLIPYLTAVAATATDPNVKATVQEVITILTVAQNIDLSAEAAVVALKGFQLPTTITAAGHDVSELQAVAGNFSSVITTLNTQGVNTGITATALGKVTNVLTQISTAQQAVAGVAAVAAAVPTTTPAATAAAAAQPALTALASSSTTAPAAPAANAAPAAAPAPTLAAT